MGRRGRKARRDHKDRKGLRDRKDFRDRKGHKDRKGLRDRKARRGHKGLRENPERPQAGLPPTAAFITPAHSWYFLQRRTRMFRFGSIPLCRLKK